MYNCFFNGLCSTFLLSFIFNAVLKIDAVGIRQ